MVSKTASDEPKRSHTEEELDEHKSDTARWIQGVEKLSIPNNQKDVVGRFVRDCNTLLTDIDASTCPSAHDLSDFTERKNSLEVQYFNITEHLS